MQGVRVVRWLMLPVLVLFFYAGCSSSSAASGGESDGGDEAPTCSPPLGFSTDDDDTAFSNGNLLAAPITLSADTSLNRIAAKIRTRH